VPLRSRSSAPFSPPFLLSSSIFFDFLIPSTPVLFFAASGIAAVLTEISVILWPAPFLPYFCVFYVSFSFFCSPDPFFFFFPFALLSAPIASSENIFLPSSLFSMLSQDGAPCPYLSFFAPIPFLFFFFPSFPLFYFFFLPASGVASLYFRPILRLASQTLDVFSVFFFAAVIFSGFLVPSDYPVLAMYFFFSACLSLPFFFLGLPSLFPFWICLTLAFVPGYLALSLIPVQYFVTSFRFLFPSLFPAFSTCR